MQSVNYAPVLVAIGIFAATFSASLSNLIGASRVLEALSRDKLFGSLLNPIMKYSLPGNPVVAVLFTWFLIQCIIFVNKVFLFLFLNHSFNVFIILLVEPDCSNHFGLFSPFLLFHQLGMSLLDTHLCS